MRVLFLSNFYPPFDRGGYELWCQEVAVELAARGHQVTVLTSASAGAATVSEEGGVQVHRLLQLEVVGGIVQTAIRVLLHQRRIATANLEHVREVVARFRPDVAMIWGMWNVPRSVPAEVERLLLGRVAYYLCDYWPSLPSAYVQQLQNSSRRRLAALPKRLTAWVLLRRLLRAPAVHLHLEHPYCVSAAVRELLVQSGVALGHARVIHGGVAVSESSLPPISAHPAGSIQLVGSRTLPA